MDQKILLSIVVCAVIVVTESERCDLKMPEYTRVKRAKYYSSPPQRFYRRPPMIYPVKGIYSHTPPPAYTAEDNPYPPSYKPVKVSRRPSNDNLGDDDVTNFVKYLSKQDLDKIIEAATVKDKFTNDVPFEFNKSGFKEEINDPNTNNDQSFSMYGPFVTNSHKPYNIELNNPAYTKDFPPKVEYISPQVNNIDFGNIPLNTEESMQSSQLSFLNSHIQKQVNEKPDFNSGRYQYTDSRVQEEAMPRPVNLREDDYDTSFTNNVPSIVKAESTSYKVESFGDLPLMNYNSKLHTVSSYHVPHYTVTANKSPSSHDKSPSSSASNPPLEPAPPVSAAKTQSDAHLKAIKIWSHKSKGMAYYLHSDGTLSLEKPQRPQISYHP